MARIRLQKASGNRESRCQEITHESEMDGGTMFSSKNFSLQTSRLVLSVAALLVTLVPFSLPAQAQRTQPTILNSDIAGISPFADANLVNPWGMVASPSG